MSEEEEGLIDNDDYVLENKAYGIYTEFKTFIDKGSIVQLAVGIIVGGAFSTVITAFVSDILAPILGLIIPSQLSEMFIVIRRGENYPYKSRLAATEDGAVTWNYGHFSQELSNFILLSLCIFFIFRVITMIKTNEKNEECKFKECPFCYSHIDIRAKRCSACTGNIRN